MIFYAAISRTALESMDGLTNGVCVAGQREVLVTFHHYADMPEIMLPTKPVDAHYKMRKHGTKAPTSTNPLMKE